MWTGLLAAGRRPTARFWWLTGLESGEPWATASHIARRSRVILRPTGTVSPAMTCRARGSSTAHCLSVSPT